MMKFGLKKYISAILIVLVLAPSILFFKPKPADAFIDCLLNAAGILGSVNSAVSAVMSVPVHDPAVSQNTSSIAGDSKSLSVKECLLDRIVYMTINTMIQNFTASTVDWINSGFEGSPSFVTDPEGFFGNIGDEVAGQWIESLGPVGQVLCSPFDLQIRLSLAFGRTSTYRRYVGCRLSDVQKNVYDAFVGGEWGANGWSNWVSISQPNNNVYGVYLSANDSILNEQLKKMGIAETELSWGNGFRPWRKCTKKDANGKCQEYEKNSRTPGSVIEDQLNNTLGSTQRRIEVADEINEILDALMNQAIGKVFSSMGLLGMSQSGYTGNGNSYLQSLTTTYENELNKTTIRPPAGINCQKTYRIYTCDNTMRYPCLGESLDKKILMEYSYDAFIDNTTGDTCTPTSDESKKTGCFIKSSVQPNELNTMSVEKLEDTIIRGCANLSTEGDANDAINNTLGSGTGSTPDNSGGNTGNATAPETLENVALNKPVVAIEHGSFIGSKVYGNDGVPGWGCTEGVFVSPDNKRDADWTVKLGSPYDIKYITITGRPSCTDNLRDINTFRLVFEGTSETWPNLNLDRTYAQPQYIYKDATTGKIIVTKILSGTEKMQPISNVTGIMIERTSFTYENYLGFSEFQAFAIVKDSSSNTNQPPTVQLSPIKISSNNIQGLKTIAGGSINYWVNITTTESNITAITMDRILTSINGTSINSIPLSNIFSKINIKRALNCGDSSTENIDPIDYTGTQISIPSPQSNLNKYCLNINASTKDDAFGSYSLEIELKDSNNLSAGKHTTSFEIEKKN